MSGEGGLQEYLLTDPDTRPVEAFRRNPEGQWVLNDMSDGDKLHVPRDPRAWLWDVQQAA